MSIYLSIYQRTRLPSEEQSCADTYMAPQKQRHTSGQRAAPHRTRGRRQTRAGRRGRGRNRGRRTGTGAYKFLRSQRLGYSCLRRRRLRTATPQPRNASLVYAYRTCRVQTFGHAGTHPRRAAACAPPSLRSEMHRLLARSVTSTYHVQW